MEFQARDTRSITCLVTAIAGRGDPLFLLACIRQVFDTVARTRSSPGFKRAAAVRRDLAPVFGHGQSACKR